jgi:ubiquinone/menaquinone biosynthesis C-methylase UbiE
MFDQKQWKNFSDNHFLKWSPLPLEDKYFLKNKSCLDAGCGSGRAIRSMLLAGAKAVTGIDMGEGCVRNSISRNSEFKDRLDVRLASVLEIPFPDNTFDFVHCDGVLHHTTDSYRGFCELTRVLKPGGTLVIAVYGKGGLMNFAIYSARVLRRIIPQSLTLRIVKLLSSDPVTCYAVMDCMYVPIRNNYHESDIRKWLENAKMEGIRRINSTWGPYGYGNWMRGEGYIKFIGRKHG